MVMKSAQAQEVADGSTPTPRKSVLFCATCGHRAPIPGDWVVTEWSADGGRRRAYECPTCRRTLIEQPVLSGASTA
jgi:hypothetical protein